MRLGEVDPMENVLRRGALNGQGEIRAAPNSIMKSKTKKLLKENTGGHLYDISMGKISEIRSREM